MTLPTDPLEQFEAEFDRLLSVYRRAIIRWVQEPAIEDQLRFKSAANEAENALTTLVLSGRASVSSPRSEGEREAVAKGLCACDEQDGGAPWDWYDDKGKERYLAKADAIISLLRGRT